jgi:hypothetical protein
MRASPAWDCARSLSAATAPARQQRHSLPRDGERRRQAKADRARADDRRGDHRASQLRISAAWARSHSTSKPAIIR